MDATNLPATVGIGSGVIHCPVEGDAHRPSARVRPSSGCFRGRRGFLVPRVSKLHRGSKFVYRCAALTAFTLKSYRPR